MPRRHFQIVFLNIKYHKLTELDEALSEISGRMSAEGGKRLNFHWDKRSLFEGFERSGIASTRSFFACLLEKLLGNSIKSYRRSNLKLLFTSITEHLVMTKWYYDGNRCRRVEGILKVRKVLNILKSFQNSKSHRNLCKTSTWYGNDKSTSFKKSKRGKLKNSS